MDSYTDGYGLMMYNKPKKRTLTVRLMLADLKRRRDTSLALNR